MKKTFFKAVLITLPIILIFVALELAARFYYYHQKGPNTFAISHIESRIKGLLTGMPDAKLREQSWAASFTELGEVPPEAGPRDGFDGVRTNPKNSKCGYLIICETDQMIPGLADIRDNSIQNAGAENTQGSKILIIGGSVAWGAYAPTIDITYFSLLQKQLADSGNDVSMTVLARGGASSEDDLAAFMLRGLEREAIRAGLQNITSNEQAHFLDCSTVFDAEQVIIFSDQWHSADRGQQLLADCLEKGLEALPSPSSHQSTSTNS